MWATASNLKGGMRAGALAARAGAVGIGAYGVGKALGAGYDNPMATGAAAGIGVAAFLGRGRIGGLAGRVAGSSMAGKVVNRVNRAFGGARSEGRGIQRQALMLGHDGVGPGASKFVGGSEYGKFGQVNFQMSQGSREQVAKAAGVHPLT